jgi:hypothetical protein
MSTNYHSPIVAGESNAPGTVNTRLATLDAAIDSRFASLVVSGGNVATLTAATVAAGQKVFTVDSTTGFIAGGRIAYALVGGGIEYNTIDTIDGAAQFTADTNVGTGGIGDNVYVSMISESEYQAAISINYGNSTVPTLPTAVEWAAGGVFNVLAFGAAGDGVTDDSAAIQAAIDAAQATVDNNAVGGTGGVVLLPPGVCIADGLEVRAHVTLRGSGVRASVLKPPSGSANPDVIHLAAGPIRRFRIEDLRIESNGNAGQHAVNAAAVAAATSTAQGGWWDGGMSNVWITGFEGTGIRLYNDGTDALLIHQHLTFSEVRVDCGAVAGSIALDITGHGGQVLCLNCIFNGPGKALAGSKAVRLAIADVRPPYSVRLLGCTIQAAETGVYIDNASSTNIIGCYFEQCYYGVDCVASVSHSRVTVVDGCRFANVFEDFGGGTDGFHMRVDEKSWGAFTNNVATGTIHRIAVATSTAATSGGGHIYVRSNAASGITTDSTFVNLMKQRTSGATVDLVMYDTIYLSGTTTVATLSSWRGPGEPITIRAHNAPQTFTETGGNIKLGAHGTKYTLPTNAAAVFMRDDQAGAFRLISESPRVGVVLLATIATKNAETAASHTIYTVPADRTLVVDHVQIRTTTFTATKSTNASASIGGNSAAFDDYLAITAYAFTANSQVIRTAATSGPIPVYAAGTLFSINITTAATGDGSYTERWDVDLFGYLV